MQKTTASTSIVQKLRAAALVLASLLVLALIVPFLVDFSSFKPQIQSIIAENLNAKVDFESARLQLIPTIGIKVKGVVVENTDPVFKGTKLFAVESLLVDAQLFPLITGKVVGRVQIDAPEFTMAKSGLKNNVTALIKVTPKEPVTDSAAKSTGKSKDDSSAESKSEPKTIEASTPKQDAEAMAKTMATIKEKLLIEGIYINRANITIRDIETKESKEPVRVRDLNIAVTNIGLDRDIKIEIDTKIDVNEAGANVKGPISINNTVHVTMGGKGLEKATFGGKLSYDDLLIDYQDVFVKNAGIPLNVTFSGTFIPGDFILENLEFNLHNLKLEAKAHVVNFADPRLTADVKIANENLASLGDLLPKHKDLLVNGQLHLSAGANGLISSLGTLETKLDFDTKLAGTDLAVQLQTTGVLPFKGKLAVNSKRIDVDSLLGPFRSKPDGAPKADEKGAAEPAAIVEGTSPARTSPATTPTASSAATPPAKDFVLSDDQRKLIQGTDAEIRVDLKEIIYSKTKLTNFKIDLDQKNLVGSLKQFNIDGFGGKIGASGRVDLEASPVSFDGAFKLVEIHPEQVMVVAKPANKDLLVGRMNLDLTVKGKGSTVPTLNKTLNGHGTFRFLDGELHTKSIGAAMGEEFDKFLTTLSVSGAGQTFFDAAEKLLNSPLAKSLGKNPPDLAKMKEQYQSTGKMKLADKSTANRSLKDVNGTIEVKDGKIYIVSSTTDSAGTMDFKSFVDLEMRLGGTSIFTASAATKEKLKSQSKYADLIFDDKNNLVVAMTLGGTVMDPKVTIGSDALRASFTSKAKILIEKEVKDAAETYLKSLMGGGAQKAAADKKVEEAKAKATEQVKNPENQKKAKDALKGLFGK
jgi:AsmA protein